MQIARDVARLELDSPQYPDRLRRAARYGGQVPTFALGDLAILDRKPVALFCSVKCPGSVILQTYDLALGLREAGITVAGGFHSPMERECLTVLLRGKQPVIVCPARGIDGMRVSTAYRRPLAEGRLLLLSPFAGKERRVTVATATARNRFVAALADAVLVAHAEPGSKLEGLCREALAWGKPVYALEDDANGHLVALGVRTVSPGAVAEQVAASWP